MEVWVMKETMRLGELLVGDGSSVCIALLWITVRERCIPGTGRREGLMSTFYRLKITATEKSDAVLEMSPTWFSCSLRVVALGLWVGIVEDIHRAFTLTCSYSGNLYQSQGR